MDPLFSRARALRPPLWLALLRAAAGPLVVLALALLVHRFSRSLFVGQARVWDMVLMNVGVNVILAVSLNLVNGFTGQFSIGHAGFMAVGAYTGAFLTYYGSVWIWGDNMPRGGFLSFSGDPADFAGPLLASGDLAFLAALLCAGAVAAVAGLVVGLPSIRLRGDYLAIVTLGFGEIVRTLLESTSDILLPSRDEIRSQSWPDLLRALGGSQGFVGQPFYTSQFWIWLLACAAVMTAYRLKTSTFGRAFLAIRENEVAAQAIGVPVTSYKVYAFVVAAFFAGIAGGLYAHQLGNALAPGELSFQKSFDVIIMVVIGGSGSITGSILGAIIVTALPEWLRQPTHVWPAGLVFIAAALAFNRLRLSKTVALLTLLTAALELMRWSSIRFEINLERYRTIFYALALIAFMLLRPQGLMGVYEAWNLPLLRRRGRRPPAAPPTAGPTAAPTAGARP